MSEVALSVEEEALRFDTLVALAEERLLGQDDLDAITEAVREVGARLSVPFLRESESTAIYSVRHAPAGKGGKNWITADKPGGKGQLPAYIQNVRNAIIRGGTAEGQATAIAIGKIRDWAEGKGDVSSEVRAAAGKAIAEWEAMKARAEAKHGIKVKEGVVLDVPAFWIED